MNAKQLHESLNKNYPNLIVSLSTIEEYIREGHEPDLDSLMDYILDAVYVEE
ncbi:MAG: hypothetical protein NC193_07330 [bacterium]|nr:hypothetical protein [bacterium]